MSLNKFRDFDVGLTVVLDDFGGRLPVLPGTSPAYPPVHLFRSPTGCRLALEANLRHIGHVEPRIDAALGGKAREPASTGLGLTLLGPVIDMD